MFLKCLGLIFNKKIFSDNADNATDTSSTGQAGQTANMKFLKYNRPKSMILAIIAISTFLLLMNLFDHKASYIIPSDMRTCTAISVSYDGGTAKAISSEQRDSVIDILSQIKVRRDDSSTESTEKSSSFRFSGQAEDGKEWWFSITSGGQISSEKSSYVCVDSSAELLWSELCIVLDHS